MFIIFCSCNAKNKVSNRLIEDCNKRWEENLKISISEVTFFRWNKMFVFGEYTSPKEISQAIGFNYVGCEVPDHNKRIVFTFNEKIPYEEDFNYVNKHHSVISFLPFLNDSIERYFISYKIEDAKFKVKRVKQSNCEDCYFYSLNPINNYITK